MQHVQREFSRVVAVGADAARTEGIFLCLSTQVERISAADGVRRSTNAGWKPAALRKEGDGVFH
jgi:hypothetical protein